MKKQIDRVEIIKKIQVALNKETDLKKLKQIRNDLECALYNPKLNKDLIKKYGKNNR